MDLGIIGNAYSKELAKANQALASLNEGELIQKLKGHLFYKSAAGLPYSEDMSSLVPGYTARRNVDYGEHLPPGAGMDYAVSFSYSDLDNKRLKSDASYRNEQLQKTKEIAGWDAISQTLGNQYSQRLDKLGWEGLKLRGKELEAGISAYNSNPQPASLPFEALIEMDVLCGKLLTKSFQRDKVFLDGIGGKPGEDGAPGLSRVNRGRGGRGGR